MEIALIAALIGIPGCSSSEQFWTILNYPPTASAASAPKRASLSSACDPSASWLATAAAGKAGQTLLGPS